MVLPKEKVKQICPSKNVSTVKQITCRVFVVVFVVLLGILEAPDISKTYQKPIIHILSGGQRTYLAKTHVKDG